MLGNVTSRPSAGQTPGVQSGGLRLPRSTPMNSSPGSDTGAAEEGDPISATAAPGADGRTEPVATAFPAKAAGEPDPVLLAGDLPAERHRLPARVTRYWRWRVFYSSLPLLVLLISGGDRSALGPLVGSLGHRRRLRCGDRCLPHHLAADPLPGLLVRDLVDGDRHPKRDHLHHTQRRPDASRADPALRTRTDRRPLPVDEPEDPYCGRLGQAQRHWTVARPTNSANGSAD